MKPLYSEHDFKNAKSDDKLPCMCYCCGNTFRKPKHEIQRGLNPNSSKKIKYCTLKCKYIAMGNSVKCTCSNCGNEFQKMPSQMKVSKSGNHFCSKSCAATYNNTHKKHGTRKSKLEVWLESKLSESYPDLEIHFNRKDAINSELDIYIPELKLAFELNGIFHYEPIFGQNKLNQIQNNDNRKFQACLEQSIELCIIDSSQQKYFKEKSSQKYLNIIKTIITNTSKNMLNT